MSFSDYMKLREFLQKDMPAMASNAGDLSREEVDLIHRLSETLLPEFPPGEEGYRASCRIAGRYSIGPRLLQHFENILGGHSRETPEKADFLSHISMVQEKIAARDMSPVLQDWDIEDSEQLTRWLSQLAQKKPAEMAFSPKSGSSKGYLFEIRDGERNLRGHLFGTMHYLLTKEMKRCAEITPYVQQKLADSILFGSETTEIDEKDLESVEKALIHVARNAHV